MFDLEVRDTFKLKDAIISMIKCSYRFNPCCTRVEMINFNAI